MRLQHSVTLLGIAFALIGASAANCQDRFLSVEYTTGHAGFEKKQGGRLLLNHTAIVFTTPDKKERPRFSIPLGIITAVSSSTERNDASVGSKILFGFLSKSRKNEYLQITTETPEIAEGVVFKVKNNESLGIATKIRHRLKGLASSRPPIAAINPVASPAEQTTLPGAPSSGPLAGGEWLGQPHGRIYYLATCLAALELPEPVYFPTEAEPQQLGYRRSQVPGC